MIKERDAKVKELTLKNKKLDYDLKVSDGIIEDRNDKANRLSAIVKCMEEGSKRWSSCRTWLTEFDSRSSAK